MHTPLVSIVDDDASVRQALIGLVHALGWRTLAFDSAEAFLGDQAASASDCVVTDIQMPGLSGIELKDQLSARGCDAPVIMITARDEPALKAKAEASGAYCFLRKPFAGDAMIACLEGALKRRPG